MRVCDFEDMYLTHLETRIWRGSFHIYFKKMLFLAFRTLLSLFGAGEKNCFINFEHYDLANGEE
jgi:hypothetical protein